jgi:deoxyribonuclease-4
MGKSAMLGSLEDTLEMSRRVPGVEPCVDFAHLHARPGDGSVNTYAEFSRALEKIDAALGASALAGLHIHLSGIAYGPKGEKEHLELKDADLNYRELFRALADYKCGGRILCESPVMEDDALVLKSAWCEISGVTRTPYSPPGR